MDKEELLKKIDEKINYLKENNIQPSELEKYINDLCSTDNSVENNVKDFVDNLSLSTKMKKYIKQIPSSESTKMDILITLSKYDDVFKEFCDFLLTGKVLKTEDSVCEKGYTAYDILDKEPCLLTHTAFLWLSYLRDNMDKTDNILETLKNGLPANSSVKLSYNVGRIRDYLSKKESTTDVVIKQLVKPYYNHPDIANEFEYWIRKKTVYRRKSHNKSGYTAKKIYEEHNDVLDIQGIFSLLITLREDPDKAIKWIKEGFPRKEVLAWII